MDLHLQPEWQRTVGQSVEIWNNGKLVCKGTVEAVMPDDTLLWISADGVSSRQMIFRSDGDQVFTHFMPRRASENNH
jgi:hypothetical protein